MSRPIPPRRTKTRDFVHVHEAPAPPKVVLKRVGVRVYEARGLLPVVVLSASEDPAEHTTPDMERIAAEVALKAFPGRAVRAGRYDPWVLLVEHLPAILDAVRWPVSEERRREAFYAVGFDDWRVTLGGRRRVRDPERALRNNTSARYGAPPRVTFGSPRWGCRLTKEEVERDAGIFVDDTPDVQVEDARRAAPTAPQEPAATGTPGRGREVREARKKKVPPTNEQTEGGGSMNEDSSGRTQHQQQLWSALDLTAHALAFDIAAGRTTANRNVPGTAVLYVETSRAIAIEGLGFEEARRLATERVGTTDEQVVRWAEKFLEAWAARVSRDYFEGSDADTLAELWGQHTGRFPRTLEESEALILELHEIIDLSPEDPARQKLLSFVPGSAKKVREVLSRRRGS